MPPVIGKPFVSRLVQVSRHGKEKLLASVMWTYAFWEQPGSGRLETFRLYFSTDKQAGKYLVNLDRTGAEFLYRQLAQALERDDIERQRHEDKGL